MDTRRSRTGEFVVLGCLFGPGIVLMALAMLLPASGPHGNLLIGFFGLAALALAALLLFVQALLPKPPETPEPAEPTAPSDQPDRA